MVVDPLDHFTTVKSACRGLSTGIGASPDTHCHGTVLPLDVGRSAHRSGCTYGAPLSPFPVCHQEQGCEGHRDDHPPYRELNTSRMTSTILESSQRCKSVSPRRPVLSQRCVTRIMMSELQLSSLTYACSSHASEAEPSLWLWPHSTKEHVGSNHPAALAISAQERVQTRPNAAVRQHSQTRVRFRHQSYEQHGVCLLQVRTS